MTEPDPLLDDYNHAARAWGWDAHIQKPRRRWWQGLRLILIMASMQVWLCIGSCAGLRLLDSTARVIHRAEEVLK